MKFKKYSLPQHAVVSWMVATCVLQPVLAGTQGSYMNSAGAGRAVDSIRVGTATAATAASPYLVRPSAGVNPQPPPPTTAWGAVAPRPTGTPTSVYCQSRGFPNYVWQIAAYVTGTGVTADNEFLENEINVIPSTCPAEIEVTTQAWNGQYDSEGSPVVGFVDANSGLILLNGHATEAAAIGVLGYEYTGSEEEPTLEDILSGELLFKYILKGPFNYGANGDTCEGLKIPFTTKTGHEKLFMVVHTLAKGNPISVTCPEDVSIPCGSEVQYPLPTVEGCSEQDIYVTYDPPAQSLPLGETLVKASFAYEDGTALVIPPTVEGAEPEPLECYFTATRSATFHGFYSPIKGTGGSCSKPLVSINCGSTIPVKFQLKCDGIPYVDGPAPQIEIRSCETGQVVKNGSFHVVSKEWHFNWDTSRLRRCTYELRVTLADGTQKVAFVKLK